MKAVILAIFAIGGSSAWAQVDMTSKEALGILEGVHWERIGKRTHFALEKAEAECMTLSNYDDRIDFDCIVKRPGQEAVLGRRDLEWIAQSAERKLPSWGLKLSGGRTDVLCFSGGNCQLTGRLSEEEEKGLYCRTLIHTRSWRSLLEKNRSEASVTIDELKCTAEARTGFAGRKKTSVTAEIRTRSGVETVLGLDRFHFVGASLEGTIDEEVACRSIRETFPVGQPIRAIIERELIENGRTSIRNTERGLVETVTLDFMGAFSFGGLKTKRVSQGDFCAYPD